MIAVLDARQCTAHCSAHGCAAPTLSAFEVAQGEFIDQVIAERRGGTFGGNFGSTHSRTYTHKMDGSHDSTRGIMHLAFGLNRRHTTSKGSTMLALSENYRVPEVLRRIADAYLALWSSDPAADWIPAAEPGIGGGGDYDIIATGEKTLWLCELGDASSYSDYESFKTAIKSASLQADAISFTHGYSYLKLNFSTATRELSDSAP